MLPSPEVQLPSSQGYMNSARQHPSHVPSPPTTSTSPPNIVSFQPPHSKQHTPSSRPTHPLHPASVVTSSPQQAGHTYPSSPAKRRIVLYTMDSLHPSATTQVVNEQVTPPVIVRGPAHFLSSALLFQHTLPNYRFSIGQCRGLTPSH